MRAGPGGFPGIHPYFSPYFLRNRGLRRFAAVNRIRRFPCSEGTEGSIGEQRICPIQIFDIFDIFDVFEGTEQIQQLVISRAISGVRIK